MPARCKACDKWGHNEGVCGTKGKKKRSSNVRSPSQTVAANDEKIGIPQSTAKGDVTENVVSTQERRSVSPQNTAKGEVAGNVGSIQERRSVSPQSTAKCEVAENVVSIQESRSAIFNTGGLSNEEKAKRYMGNKVIAGSSAKGWTTVSPAKTGRSLFNSAQGTYVVASVSKFFVLSVDEIEEGEGWRRIIYSRLR